MTTLNIRGELIEVEALSEEAHSLIRRIKTTQEEIDRLTTLLEGMNQIQCSCYERLVELVSSDRHNRT